MKIFRESLRELKDLRALAVTAMLIAVSMLIESFTINLGFIKINFSFLAIAAIGMLYGPAVSFLAGGICDVLGYLVSPSGGFFFIYTVIAAVQGLLYGLIAYRKLPKASAPKAYRASMLTRLIIARVADVLFINLICNTAANYYYGFLADKTLPAAIAARVAKNLLELPVDLLLISVVLMAVLEAYAAVFGRKKAV